VNPLSYVQNRFNRWLLARLKPSDSITLTQRNVYILPTRAGFMLGATLLVLLVASINYQLNLGYLLTFLLAGSTVVSMYISHGTLRGITMHLIAPNANYVGASVAFDVKINSDRRAVRHGLGVSVRGTGQWSWTDVPGRGSSNLQVALKVTQRGLTPLPTLTAETRFPLGTFRVWTVWRPAAQILVYPAPEPLAPPLPPGVPRASSGTAQQTSSSGEFDGVRAYRRGDPLKTVVWKKAAKALAIGSNDLVSRDTEHTQTSELWLEFSAAGMAGAADKEARLSRLSAWVLRADKQALHYGLRLPSREIAPASGEAHKRQCLEALALC